MGMTPSQFFESFVILNTEDCREHPCCVRRAFNAAVSASHLADHNFYYSQRHSTALASRFRHVGEYVEYLSTQTSGAFKDVRSIANAYKHLYTNTDPKRDVHSSISSPGAIVSVELNADDADVVSIEESYEGTTGAEYVVVFTRKDGSRSAFLPVLDAVVEYWCRESFEDILLTG